MKRKIVVLCMAVLAMSLCSCTQAQQKGEKKKLTVITEDRLFDQVNWAVKFIEGTDSTIEIEVQVLPEEEKERETKIQNLRTQIIYWRETRKMQKGKRYHFLKILIRL